ncbi:hypothetical protein [Curtobacterium oceanosedimentum]|uniref:hypothetical protein n=1 Tax=Curtobacterium oceanosedimentum TaxID=465820 RepID=UPI00128FBE1E|nr:hypothetical protein [Curtobacterium oceanosedimentum]
MVHTRGERAIRFVESLGFDKALVGRLLNADRAYVVGMGPSIGKFDLSALHDSLVFGVNHAAAAGVRHDLLFLADDRRVTSKLQAGTTPIVTIDACLDGNEDFFEGKMYYADIKAVHYAQKIPAILDVDEYPVGLPVAYWTGSVITDLVLPFAVECGIPQLVCIGLDGVEGSFPVTHAWGMDSLTRSLQDQSASDAPEVLPPSPVVAHLQEKAAALAAKAGTFVTSATPGGNTEALGRIDPLTALPPGTWRGSTPACEVDGSYIAVGTSVFELRANDADKVELILRDSPSGRADNSHLDGCQLIAEVGFLGNDFLALRVADDDLYITTKTGFDRYELRRVTQSFNTALSSFRVGFTEAQARRQAVLVGELASVADRRMTIGDEIASLYLGVRSEAHLD